MHRDLITIVTQAVDAACLGSISGTNDLVRSQRDTHDAVSIRVRNYADYIELNETQTEALISQAIAATDALFALVHGTVL